MLDWCPVCENLILPERHTITLPPLPATATTAVDESKTATTTPLGHVRTATGRGSGKLPPGKRPGLNRQNSRAAAAARKPTDVSNGAGEQQNDVKEPAGDVVAAAPARRRVVISQGPTPLYCSEECRRKDYLRSTLSQPNLQAWTANHGFTTSNLPFAAGQNLYNSTDVAGRSNHYSSPRVRHHSDSPPSPFLLEHATGAVKDLQNSGKGVPYVDARRQAALQRHPNNSASSASATATTTTDSSESLASLVNPPSSADVGARQPDHLRMTAIPSLELNSGSVQTLLPGSAPATTDMDSHPSRAVLNGTNLPRPLKLNLDKWNNLPDARQAAYNDLTNTQDQRRGNRDQSAYDLYKSTYPLAFETRRQQPTYASTRTEKRRSGSRHQQAPSRRATDMGGWGMGGEDITPTQSLLITKAPVRKDDSFDRSSTGSASRNGTAPPSSRASDSGSSDHSTSVRSRGHSETSHRKSSRNSKRHLSDSGERPQYHYGAQQYSTRPYEMARSESSSSHAAGSSYRSNSSRQGPHPLSSSFSARDMGLDRSPERERERERSREAEPRDTFKQRAPLSGSLPQSRSVPLSNGRRWSRRGSGDVPRFTAIEEVPSQALKTDSQHTEDEHQTNPVVAPVPASSSAMTPSPSSATIVASASPMRSLFGSFSGSSATTNIEIPSSASSSGSAMSSKRNSSFANLAGMAASLFGFGGFGALTMTSTSIKLPPTPTSCSDTTPARMEDDVASSLNKPISPRGSFGEKAESETSRGRSRASSRASRTELLVTGATTTSTVTPSTTPSHMHALFAGDRMSASMQDMPIARKPLGPLPLELEEKSKAVSKEVQDRVADEAAERKERRKEKRPSVGAVAGAGLVVDVARAEAASGPHSSAVAPTPTSAWDPDLVKEMKQKRKLSREHQQSPFLTSPPVSPTSPLSPTALRRPRTFSSQSQSKSHSRSNSYSQRRDDVVQEEAEDSVQPLPRTQSTQSMASSNASSSRHRHHHGQHPSHHHHTSSQEPISPSHAYGTTGRGPPRGLSMTSLSTYGGMGKQPMMYGAGPPSPLARTNSQPYLAKLMSASPEKSETVAPGLGGRFQTPGDLYPGFYPYPHPGSGFIMSGPPTPSQLPPAPTLSLASQQQRRESHPPKPVGPMYPILNLPVTRKKKVIKHVVKEDGTEMDVLTDGSEQEEVYEKRKRLFYFDR